VVLTSSSFIEAEHLPLHVQDLPAFKLQKGFKASKLQAIEQFERQVLADYLSEAKGNVSRAALLANLPRRTFHRLMAKYQLSRRGLRVRH
jgi:DNA-binding NtrC family response regulator